MLDKVTAPTFTPAVKVEDVRREMRPMRRLVVRKEHPAMRCEICHQSDALAPNGECKRCQYIDAPGHPETLHRLSNYNRRLIDKLAVLIPRRLLRIREAIERFIDNNG